MYRRRGKTEEEIEAELARLDLELDIDDDSLPEVDIDQQEESDDAEDPREEIESTLYRDVLVEVRVCSGIYSLLFLLLSPALIIILVKFTAVLRILIGDPHWFKIFDLLDLDSKSN